MKETSFQRILVKSLREAGAVVFNIHGHAMQVAGIPDLYVAHPIWTGWLELKAGTNVATKLQERTLRKLMTCGVDAVVLLANKPRMTIKIYGLEDKVLTGGHILFMSNDIDGVNLLNKIKEIMDLYSKGFTLPIKVEEG